MKYLRYFIFGLVIILFQLVLVPLISIRNIAPDIVLLFVTYISLREGQIAGTTAGFISGMIIDVFGDSIVGLSALSKTIAGFIAGYFFNPIKIDINIGSFRFPGIVMLSAVVNNLIFFFPEIVENHGGLNNLILKFIVASAIYTSLFSLVPMFVFSSKR